MAQVNIACFKKVSSEEKRLFAISARDIVAEAVHGLEKSEIKPDSVSVLVIPIDASSSISGAEIEVQVLVSGNNWPVGAEGKPYGVDEAKIYFDKLADKIYKSLGKVSSRKIYVWVTPFTASGWAS